MDKVTLYILDTRKHTFNELLSFANLNEEEIKSLEKFRVLEMKKEQLISLYFKKEFIGEYQQNEFGKPISNHMFFNISHSKGVAVLAIAKNHDIGVDIEVVKPKEEDVIKYISNEEEYNFIKTEFDFLAVWTNKESLVKCLGTGIKSNIKGIPALPLNGVKTYNGETYYSKNFKYNDAIISITLKDDSSFEYEIKTINIS